jgi:hypothetical protein
MRRRRTVEIDPANPRLHRDGNGLPMHGLLGCVSRIGACTIAARMTAARHSARPSTSPPIRSARRVSVPAHADDRRDRARRAP